MRKLLYLFLTLTVISCSKDDDNDNDPNTFTEKYNSIVWIGDDSVPDDSYFVAVYNQPEKVYYWETDLDGEYCFPITFGQANEFGDIYTVTENTLNNLIITNTSSEGEEYNIKFTVSNDESLLTLQFLDGSGYTETYSRSSSANPCL